MKKDREVKEMTYIRLHLMTGYQADQTHIDALTLNVYLLELSQLVLMGNWAHDILKTIFSSSQGECNPHHHSPHAGPHQRPTQGPTTIQPPPWPKTEPQSKFGQTREG